MATEVKEAALRLIDSASVCTVDQFMKCLFEHDLSVLIIEGEPTQDQLSDALDNILTDYIDNSGLTDRILIELTANVERLKIRINVIAINIILQQQCIALLGRPLVEGFNLFKKYGHRLTWDAETSDLEEFKKKLLFIQTIEKSAEARLDEEQQQLTKLQSERSIKADQAKNTRADFIDLLTVLPTAGFVINRHITTVEELSSMVRQFNQIKTRKLKEQQPQHF